MKRSLLAFVFLMGLSLSTHAQMQKGSWIADGQVGGYATNVKSEHQDPSWDDYNLWSKATSFYFGPGVGYFIQDNLALGISGRFQVVTASAQNGENEALRGNQLTYGMGLFSRKYFPAGERLSFYGELRASGLWGTFGNIEEESSDRTVSTKIQGFKASAGLGVQYLVKDFLGLHLQTTLVDYDRFKNTGVTYDYSGTSSNLNARLFSSFQIGASFFF